MSDAWEEIQAIKSKRNSLREKLQKRKKERQDILNLSAGGPTGKIYISFMYQVRYR
jgi:thiaminase